MKFSVTAVTCLAAATGAFGAAADVVKAIGKISTELSTFNKTLNTYTKGGSSQTSIALKLQSQATDIQDALSAALKASDASKAFGRDGSLSVSSAVLSLYPDVVTTVNNILSHKKQFTGPPDFRSVVGAALAKEQDLTKKLGTSVTKKLSAEIKTLAPCLINQLDAIFVKARKAYPDTE